MKRMLVAAAGVLAVLLLVSAPPAAAQAVASLSAAQTASLASATAQPAAGCWECIGTSIGWLCNGGAAPGYWNCQWNGFQCRVTSPGCGAGASLPLDPDGAAQYVSRGSLAGLGTVIAESGGAPRVNCEGVVVARHQTEPEIAAVRARTGALVL